MKRIIKVRLLRKTARLPSKSSKGSAGFDLYAAEGEAVPASSVNGKGQVNVGTAAIPIGIAIQLPSATIGKIASRSGLAIQSNIEVGAGWIDCDFRGEIIVQLRNFGSIEYQVQPGDRIAQLIILSSVSAEMALASQLDNTERGSRGLGSTGR